MTTAHSEEYIVGMTLAQFSEYECVSWFFLIFASDFKM